MTDLTTHSITSLHQLLTTKQITSYELTQKFLDRAEAINPTTHAFITIEPEHALSQARAADKLIASAKAHTLTGIPFCLKDAYITKDLTTTCASKVLHGYNPPYSATVYQKLLDQGSVLIGKNNQDAWGHGGSSENTDYQPVTNPWDSTRTAGGSSGGSAAALISDSAVFAIGEDTGGSIRNPASFCNISGLKVTYGRVSRYGAIAYASSLDTVGPMAKSVVDLALVLQAIAGPDPLDASSSTEPIPDYSRHLNQSLKGKTIGFIKEHLNSGLDEEVKQTLLAALDTYISQGVTIKELSLPTISASASIYYILAFSETSSNLARYDGVRYGHSRDLFSPETKRRIMMGSFSLSSGYYDAYYKKALQARTQLIHEFNQAFTQVDVIASPVMPFPAYKFGQLNTSDNYVIAMYLADIYTCATNPVGIPSLAIPAGFSTNHLPIGIQLMGPLFSEASLLNFGHQYQQLTDWHTRRPKLIPKS